MDLTNKNDLSWGDTITAMGLPGYEENELRYTTGSAKFEKDLIFVKGGGLTEGASGGSIVSDAGGNPTLVGFNVFKAGWWNETETGEFKFVQTSCGGPTLWGSSFCSLTHVAEEIAFDDPRVLNGGGIIHDYDGSQCTLPGLCSTDADCDDGIFCNGVEQCISGQCVADTSESCRPGERCDEEKDECLPPCTQDKDCSDGIWCNGKEICVEGE